MWTSPLVPAVRAEAALRMWTSPRGSPEFAQKRRNECGRVHLAQQFAQKRRYECGRVHLTQQFAQKQRYECGRVHVDHPNSRRSSVTNVDESTWASSSGRSGVTNTDESTWQNDAQEVEAGQDNGGGSYVSTMVLCCLSPLLHDHMSDLVIALHGDCQQDAEPGCVTFMDCILYVKYLSIISNYQAVASITSVCVHFRKHTQTNSVALSPQANYTD
jgi:hypothetical protein